MVSAVATVSNQYAAVNVVVTYTRWIDTFSRTVASGWGTPDVGPGSYSVFVNSGTINNFSVNGSQGLMTATTTNAVNRAQFNNFIVADIDFTTQVSINGLAVGGTLDTELWMRAVDGNNFVLARLRLNTDNSLTGQILDRVAGVDQTPLATGTIAGITYSANKVLGIRVTALGGSIQLKVWDTSATGEPPTAQITTNAETTYLSAATGMRLVTNANTGATVPRTWTFDNLALNEYAAVDSTTTLVRVTPDGTRTPVRNQPVLSSAGQSLFWDDEAPLSTTVFYSFGASVNTTTATGISNSVIITGSGGEIGWLKDPVIPANDIVLNFASKPAQLCATGSAISLATLGDETYPDTDGEFDIINAPRPLITTMVRDDIVSSATLVSQQQSDILLLRTIFASGRPLLLQMLTTYGWAISTYGSDYIHVRDVVSHRPGLQDMRHNQRVWDLPFAVCNTPANSNVGLTGSNGVGVGHATYNQMKASGLTYNALKATAQTYTSLAQGNGY